MTNRIAVQEMAWSYDLGEDAALRLPVLAGGVSFSEITARIVAEMSVLCCHSSAIGGTGFKRPVFTVFVGPTLFDLFFNSVLGYRAAYFRSPGTGLDANAAFMRAAAPRLVVDPTLESSKLPPAFVHDSLITPSAKAWLAETGKEQSGKCPGCKGEWSAGSAGPSDLAEIRNGRWEVAQGQKAEWGRKAPRFTSDTHDGRFHRRAW